MNTFRSVLTFNVPLLLLLVSIGCGGSNRAAVTGQVTLNGRAVEDGTISFIPAAGTTGSPAWGEIKAGNYSIPAKNGPAIGTNRVEIRWTLKTGRMLPAVPPSPAREEVVEAIPTRYNSKSELKAELNPGKNTVDFQLISNRKL